MSERYVIKNADGLYADGGYAWVEDRRDAFVFTDTDHYEAYEWACGHAGYLRIASHGNQGVPSARVVRLRRRRKK